MSGSKEDISLSEDNLKFRIEMNSHANSVSEETKNNKIESNKMTEEIATQ